MTLQLFLAYLVVCMALGTALAFVMQDPDGKRILVIVVLTVAGCFLIAWALHTILLSLVVDFPSDPS